MSAIRNTLSIGQALRRLTALGKQLATRFRKWSIFSGFTQHNKQTNLSFLWPWLSCMVVGFVIATSSAEVLI
jgi:hypothetical protein